MFGRVLRCYTVYTFPGALATLTEFCPVQNSLYVQVLRSLILQALLHGTPAAGVSYGVVQGMELPNFHRGRHLYSAGRPSRWASAHILVLSCFFFFFFFSSPNLSGRRLDVYHVSTHGVALVQI